MYFPDELPPKPRRRAGPVKITVRIILALLVLFGIGLVIISRVGGNGDNLRAGLEALLGKVNGDRPVRVGTLHGFWIFPYFRVYADDITVRPHPAGTAADEEILLSVGTLMYSQNFWDVFFQRHNFEGLRVENISSAAGYVLPQDLNKVSMTLQNELPAGGAGLTMQGAYGAQDFTLTLGMDYTTRNHRPVYKFRLPAPVTFNVGTLEVSGAIKRVPRGLMLTVRDVKGFPQDTMTVHPDSLTFYYNENGPVLEHRAKADQIVTFAVRHEETGKKLVVTAKKLALADIVPLMDFYRILYDRYDGRADHPLPGDVREIDVKIELPQEGNKSYGVVHCVYDGYQALQSYARQEKAFVPPFAEGPCRLKQQPIGKARP